MRENLIIPAGNNNDQFVLEGIRWLVSTAKAGKGEGLIAVNGFAVLERVARRIFGERRAKQLRAGMATVDGVRLAVMSDAKPLFDFSGPVFALYPSARLLDRIDTMYSVTHLLVIPWLEKDVEDWIRAWQPHEIGEDAEVAGSIALSNPIVAAAMDDLVVLINVGTGIVSPTDKAHAIEIFRCLKLNGTTYDPDEIRAWLVAEAGMEPGDANDVRDLAQRILDGRTVQGAGSPRKNTQRYKRWVAEAGAGTS